ncbi:Lipid A export ATP-binding/permease protein MsbA [Tautonia plasticadhaerens]|uniref:Lipid A export ATP-binding/permease protein MsbA n=2 Tax=Tautonia plasticadhaerens TaxID=2527974 RepID=A0A518GZ82_9BACT|nr:Lipid A export ATP-binding/permease protein MsbA [Tautonia plasticadhaerens]
MLYGELFRLMRGHRRGVAIALATLTVGTLLRLIPPAATKVVIDYVLLDRPLPDRIPAWAPIPSSSVGKLGAVVAVVFAVSVIGALLGVWGRWRATVVSKQLQVRVRRRVFEHASRLPLHRIYQLKSGGLSSLIRDDAGAPGEMVFNMVYNPWRALTQLVGGLAILAWIDWRFLLGAVGLIPVAYWADRLWNRVLRPIHRRSRRQRQEIDAKSTETFGGMRVVRAFGRQKTEAARFVRESHLLTRLEMLGWYRARAFDLFWDLLMPSASGALLLYGGWQVLRGELSPGDLMMFLVYLAMLLEPIAVLASNMTTLQNNLSGFDRVLDMLGEPTELASNPGAIHARKGRVGGRISIEGLRFRYPGHEEEVIRGIDLEVEPGETIALVGRSGAGKTTLCNLVARFYDPTGGSIRLDGTDLRDVDLQSYRRLLGIVEQDVFLFDGSVAENIAYADRRASRSAIERAARAANASGFIEALPGGYDTLIGERGVRLSGGQRQRLAIARAILADPVIFILDEATSNLDTESERLIQAALADLMRDRTSFVIAHRLSTIRDADRILVLDSGEVAEVGSHDELMERSGLYRDMVELQRMEGGA